MLIDYHLHNHFSPDSTADTRALLDQEIALGIQEVSLTNHAEWFIKSEAKSGSFDYEEATRRFASIHWEIEQLRPEYPTLPIMIGCELQYDPSHLAELSRFVRQADLDFVLGSVHVLEDVVISSHRKVGDFFEKYDEETAYRKYFAEMAKLIEWGDFDVAAHFDVIKKYGTRFYGAFQPEKYQDAIWPLLTAMKAKGIGLELNTGSLHTRCEELFPHPDILKWAVDIGIENFTLSSDAHEPENAGKYIKEALEIAKSVGIKTVSTYRKRQAARHAL